MVKMPKMMKRKKVEPVVEEKPNPFGLLGVLVEKTGMGGIILFAIVMLLLGNIFLPVVPPVG